MQRYEMSQLPAADVLRQVADHLAQGQVGVVPTETVYGLVCARDNQAGRQRICQMKDRDQQKPCQILIASHSDLDELVGPGDEPLHLLAQAFWPGPLTIVAPGLDGGELGLRWPANDFLQQLIQALGGPLLATSANRSGSPPPTTADAAVESLVLPPDFVVAGREAAGVASTVVRLRAGQAEILRQGGIDAASIQSALGPPATTPTGSGRDA